MTATLTRIPTFAELPKDYHGLVDALGPIESIRDDGDLERATEIGGMMAGHNLSPDQERYFTVLSDLIYAYEKVHHPVDLSSVTPAGLLRSLVKLHKLTVTDLGKIIGDKSSASRVLSGERELSKAHIRKLADHFRVSPAAFL